MFRALGSFTLVCVCLAASAQDELTDRHFDDPASPLYRSSGFAHGYAHGYEQGFSRADRDFQMGLTRAPESFPEFSKDVGYRPAFGARSRFREGFREGFRGGYLEGIGGRSFNAVAVLRYAARGLPTDAPLAPRSAFDDGFTDGYLSARSRGAADQASNTDYDSSPPPCAQQERTMVADEYCRGFTRGYPVGYRDGYLAPPPEERKQIAGKR